MTEQAKLHIKPAPGLRIPNPDTGSDLKAEGEMVANTTYWRRLLRSKDVVAAGNSDNAAGGGNSDNGGSAAGAKKGK